MASRSRSPAHLAAVAKKQARLPILTSEGMEYKIPIVKVGLVTNSQLMSPKPWEAGTWLQTPWSMP